MIRRSGRLTAQVHSSARTLAMFFGSVSAKIKTSSVMMTVAKIGPEISPAKWIAKTVARAVMITCATLLPISSVMRVLSNFSKILRARRALFFPSSAHAISLTRLQLV